MGPPHGMGMRAAGMQLRRESVGAMTVIYI